MGEKRELTDEQLDSVNGGQSITVGNGCGPNNLKSKFSSKFSSKFNSNANLINQKLNQKVQINQNLNARFNSNSVDDD